MTTRRPSPVDVLSRLGAWQARLSNDLAWLDEERFALYELENPGWGLRSSLVGTNLARQDQPSTLIERSEGDWLQWKVSEGVYTAHCGSMNLEEMLTVFLDYVERVQLLD